MNEDEFMVHVKRVWEALPDDADVALSVLGLICNSIVRQVDNEYPGTALSWMTTLQSVFDKGGIRT